MKRIAVSLALVLMLPAYVGHAETVGFGVGISTCAVFGNMYKLNQAGTEDEFFTWAQGFMTGMNALAINENGKSRDLASIPFEEQRSFLRHFCDDHPLRTYAQVVLALYENLKFNLPRKH